MCASYTPSQTNRINRHFGATLADISFKPVAFPGYAAPIVRKRQHGLVKTIECIPACFGLVPQWAGMKLAKHTYNARSETVADKPSYRNAWRNGQFCIIPADSFFEPSYESGKAVRWELSHMEKRPLGIAGLWECKTDGADGFPLISFSMLTINADQHPLMRRFHKPSEEKRMVVILKPEQYAPWLHADAMQATHFLKQYPADRLLAVPSPNTLQISLLQSDLFAS